MEQNEPQTRGRLMDKLNAIWNELTLGPVSVFSALSMLGMLALLVLAHRDVSFRWGVYLALGIALIRAPLVWHKRQLLGDQDGSSFVAVNAITTFLGMVVIWTFVRWFFRKATRA
jgi:hypothetical protein